MFSRTALSLRCVCVWAGRRRAFDACFFAVLHGSSGAVDKSVFSRVFARALYVFLFFFEVFAYQKRQNPPACVAAIYRVILITDLLSRVVLTLLKQWITSIQWQSRKKLLELELYSPGIGQFLTCFKCQDRKVYQSAFRSSRWVRLGLF